MARERTLIQWAKRPALYGLSNTGGRTFLVGEKRALRGASIGGWIRAAEDKFSSESMLMRAVGGGVDRSSLGTDQSGINVLSDISVVMKWLAAIAESKSLVFATEGGTGLRLKVSYGVNRGDGVSGTRRFIGENPELGCDKVEGVEYSELY
jgi:hypothetical protein